MNVYTLKFRVSIDGKTVGSYGSSHEADDARVDTAWTEAEQMSPDAESAYDAALDRTEVEPILILEN